MSPNKDVQTTGQLSSYLIAKAKIPSLKQQKERLLAAVEQLLLILKQIIVFQHLYFSIVLLLSFFLETLSFHLLHMLTANEHKQKYWGLESLAIFSCSHGLEFGFKWPLKFAGESFIYLELQFHEFKFECENSGLGWRVFFLNLYL